MTYMYGKTFIKKILNHERDFTGIALQPLFDFNKDKNLFRLLHAYLKEQYGTFQVNPLILDDVEMKGVRISNLEIPYLQAENLNMTESWLRKVKFPNSKLPYLKIWGSRLEICDFENSFQEGAIYNDAQVISSKYNNAILDKIACDPNTKFDHCNLEEVSMRYVEAAHVYFRGSNLTGLNVAYTDFYFANLKGTQLIDLKNLRKSKNLNEAMLDNARMGSNEYVEVRRLRELKDLDLPLIVGKQVSFPDNLDNDFESLVQRLGDEEIKLAKQKPASSRYYLEEDFPHDEILLRIGSISASNNFDLDKEDEVEIDF